MRKDCPRTSASRREANASERQLTPTTLNDRDRTADAPAARNPPSHEVHVVHEVHEVHERSDLLTVVRWYFLSFGGVPCHSVVIPVVRWRSLLMKRPSRRQLVAHPAKADRG